MKKGGLLSSMDADCMLALCQCFSSVISSSQQTYKEVLLPTFFQSRILMVWEAEWLAPIYVVCKVQSQDCRISVWLWTPLSHLYHSLCSRISNFLHMGYSFLKPQWILNESYFLKIPCYLNHNMGKNQSSWGFPKEVSLIKHFLLCHFS